jgi:RHS repeat-associated protein
VRGRLRCDVENRLQQAVHTLNGTEQYVYNPSNQRVWKKDASQSETAYMYGPDGARLATLNASWGGGDHFSNTSLELRLGGRLITSPATGDSVESLAQEDRLGTVGASSYFPYGETRGGGPGFQFATYRRDSATQFDYAKNRYYSSKIARFLTPDPYAGSVRRGNPQSWNRYAYVKGDPVNRNDPSGRCDVFIAGINMNPGSSAAFSGAAAGLGAIQVYPYANSADGTWRGVLAGVSSVVSQGLVGPNAATDAAAAAILQAARDRGPINIVAFSGGAQTVAGALRSLPASIGERIDNVTYVSPGSVSGDALPRGNRRTTAVVGTRGWEPLIGFFPIDPLGTGYVYTGCGHDADCQFSTALLLLYSLSGSPCSVPGTISTGPTGLHEFTNIGITFGGDLDYTFHYAGEEKDAYDSGDKLAGGGDGPWEWYDSEDVILMDEE